MSCICTIGFFDGVHLGHQHLINQLCNVAEELKLPPHVITFSLHPRNVCLNDSVRLLSTREEKTAILKNLGVKECHVLDFSPEMAKLSARDFMEQYLIGKYHAKALLVGYDHHFGHPKAGEGFEQYCAYGQQLGIEVIGATPFPGPPAGVSSSNIRKAIESADIIKANRMLGRPYSITSQVVHGRGVGRTLGFPTANLKLLDSERLLPPTGCYAVRVIDNGTTYAGMLYLGARPTFDEKENNHPSIEVNLLDFDGDLYNHTLIIEFHDFLRSEKRFENTEALRQQLKNDRQEVANIIKL